MGIRWLRGTDTRDEQGRTRMSNLQLDASSGGTDASVDLLPVIEAAEGSLPIQSRATRNSMNGGCGIQRLQQFNAWKPIPVTKTMPPIGFAEQGIIDGNFASLSSPSYQQQPVVFQETGDHPELVHDIGIVFPEFCGMDRSRPRSGMRALLC